MWVVECDSPVRIGEGAEGGGEVGVLRVSRVLHGSNCEVTTRGVIL